MERITFNSYDAETGAEKEIGFYFDGSIEQFVEQVRSFGLALTFTEKTIDNWIENPFA